MTQVQQPKAKPGPLQVKVRKYAPGDRAHLTAVMARAFDDDPIANWFAAQDARRARRIHDFMEVALKITARHNEIYTTDGIQGGAYWAPPGKLLAELRVLEKPFLDFFGVEPFHAFLLNLLTQLGILRLKVRDLRLPLGCGQCA